MASEAVDRRFLLRAAGTGIAGLALGLAGTKRVLAADVTIGIVYVGAREDFGWNQAHAVAAQALKSVPGVRVLEEERVPETEACAQTMESIIKLDGASLFMGTSFGYYNPFMLNLARKYPQVEFRHSATLWNKDKDPTNAGSNYSPLLAA